MKNKESGFLEIEHAADLAIKVWANDLPALFRQAILGMNALSGIEVDVVDKAQKIIELDGIDNETLLVIFLSEILYLGEQENFGVNDAELLVGNGKLKAVCTGGNFIHREKAIKAVTFHNLEIFKKDEQFQVEIIFDV